MKIDLRNFPNECRLERQLNRAKFIDYLLPKFYNLTICAINTSWNQP